MQNSMKLVTNSGKIINVLLKINCYVNNDTLYIGLMSEEHGHMEPYGNMTVNLSVPDVPNYCAFIDTNNITELEKFIEENGLGEPTGFEQKSGFCSYPLYKFHAERLRELCPDGMAAYEKKIGII